MRFLLGGGVLWGAATLLALTGACVPPYVPPAPAPEDSAEAREDLTRVMTSYWRATIQRRPKFAMAVGQRVDVMPSPALKEDTDNQNQLIARRLGHALDRIDASALTPRDYATLQTLRWELDVEAEGATLSDLDFSLLSPTGSSVRDALDVLRSHPFTTSTDLDRYLFLLDGLALWFTDAIGVLEQRQQQRVVATRDEVDGFVRFLRTLRRLVEAGELQVPARRLVSIDTALITPFRAQEKEGITDRVMPAMDSLVTWLEAYRLDAKERPGLWQYPGGKEYYRHLLRRRLGLEVEPEEAHKAALKQLARVDSLLALVTRQMSPKGALRLDSLRAAAAVAPIPADSAATLVRLHLRSVRDTLRSSVANLPDTTPVVRVATALEALLEPDGFVEPPEVLYTPPTLVVTPWWGSTTARLEGPARWFAWSWPGRALATGVSHEAGTLNPVVVLHPSLSTSAGWAEYSASMGGELGYYGDPLATWGRLMQEGLNAAWLVVDTGIHTYGWTRGQALSVLRPFSAATNAELDSMFVARVVQAPGSAGAAAIGAREMAAMRTWMQRLLGKEFSPARWHQELLTLGPVPLPVLAAHLEWWGWEIRRDAAARSDAERRKRGSGK